MTNLLNKCQTPYPTYEKLLNYLCKTVNFSANIICVLNKKHRNYHVQQLMQADPLNLELMKITSSRFSPVAIRQSRETAKFGQ